MSQERRLLVITFSYPPVLSPRAFRWEALTAHFASCGWEVHVLTSWQPGLPHRETMRGVHVHRAGWTAADTLRSRLGRPTRAHSRHAEDSKRGKASLAELLRRCLWRPFYWPDSSFLWYWPARRAALRLAGTLRPDVIVTVSPTFTAHLVGRAVRRRLAARWILDIGDPFSLQEESPPNNRRLFGPLNLAAERQILELADHVCVTTEGTAARYAEAFPTASRKLRVIPPLAAGDDATPSWPTAFPPDEAIRLVYAGTLYKGLREPGYLLRLVDALRTRFAARKIELHLFGEMRVFAEELRVWGERLGGSVQVHGLVSREMVAAALDGADIIVNIGNNSRDQLPSKVVEYAATGRPILNLVRTPADTSAVFLGSYPDLLTLIDEGGTPTDAQIASAAAFLERLPRRLSREVVDAWLRPYRLPAIAAAYEQALR